MREVAEAGGRRREAGEAGRGGGGGGGEVRWGAADVGEAPVAFPGATPLDARPSLPPSKIAPAITRDARTMPSVRKTGGGIRGGWMKVT